MITNKHKRRPILPFHHLPLLKVTPCTRIPGESLQAKLHTVHHQDTFSCIQRLRTESGRCVDGVMKKNIGNFAFNWRVIFVYNQLTEQASFLKIFFTWRSSTESTWLNISISPVSSLYTYAALFTYSLKTMLLLLIKLSKLDQMVEMNRYDF